MQTTAPVVICRPHDYLFRRILHCPTCKRRRRFACRDRGPWYEPTATCCGCGDTWIGSFPALRPARRGWRAEAAAQARRDWEKAGPRDEAAHRAWLRKQAEKTTQRPRDCQRQSRGPAAHPQPTPALSTSQPAPDRAVIR